MHEHSLDLGGLVRTTHPTLDAHVRSPAGRSAGQNGGQVAGAEAYQRIVDVRERCDNDFSDIAGRNGIAGTRSDDFDQHALVDDESFARRCLVRDRAHIG